jgi:ElaB/YqjD/DUF883 family membrane-anchored ribosome-binding protein
MKATPALVAAFRTWNPNAAPTLSIPDPASRTRGARPFAPDHPRHKGRDGMSTTTYGGSSDLSERASNLSDAASRQMDRAYDSAGEVARTASEQGRHMMAVLDRTVREQPLMALAAAGALGLVIGALWKMDGGRASSRWYYGR